MDDKESKEVIELCLLLKEINLKNECSNYEEQKILEIFSNLILGSSLQGLSNKEDIPVSSKDFDNQSDKSSHLRCILRLLEELTCIENTSKMNDKFFKKIIMDSFFVASQFQNPNVEWSNGCYFEISKNIIDAILIYTKVTTVSELLLGKQKDEDSSKGLDVNAIETGCFPKLFPNGIFKLYLQKLSEKFNKDSWKKYPFHMESYLWSLSYVKHPYLMEYLSYCLPPALFILDDWEKKHKIIGSKVLKHIITNTAGAELRWYGRIEVIFEALLHHLYSKEHEVLCHIYPAVVLAASVIEKDPNNTTKTRKNSFDSILELLLREMSFEENLLRRSVYANALKSVVSAMELHAIRWSKMILDVCSDYLATYEGPDAHDRLEILDTLKCLIKYTWPRIHHYVGTILKMTVKLVYEVSINDPPVNKEVQELIFSRSKEVVNLLHSAAPQTVQNVCSGVEEMCAIHRNTIGFVFEDIFK